jgi:hypothetical protein
MRGGFRTAIVYGGGLIALYLVVVYSTGASADTKAAQGFTTSTIATLQGR